MIDSTPVWFITGAGSGFGQAIARRALADGDRVAASSRHLEDIHALVQASPDRVLPLTLDVTDPQAARAAVGEAVSHFGRVDIVVNNAGYGHVGAVEELSEQELREQLEVDLFGVVNVTRAALPYLRRQRSGHFVQMSSLNGVEGLVGGGYYAASKFGVEGLSESLALEVAHLGITVTIVEPGPHRTRFASTSSAKWARPIADYDASVGRMREGLSQLDGAQPGDPERAARAIATAVKSDKPPLRLPLGAMALNHIRAKFAEQLDELEAWAELSASSDFPINGEASSATSDDRQNSRPE
jgi:NAD(P)-dependent dehydrogenase (short-subunit alcohol dehydrogenase family)